ncbi:MAG: hypothetical protein RR514_07400, partial [Christensenella sp.]
MLEETSAEQLSILVGSSPALTISQQMIDEALCLGGNQRNSLLRICAKYKKGRSIAENATFLKEEYMHGGRGFY